MALWPFLIVASMAAGLAAAVRRRMTGVPRVAIPGGRLGTGLYTKQRVVGERNHRRESPLLNRLPDRQALRNRLRFVYAEVGPDLQRRCAGPGSLPVRALSLGTSSAPALVEALSNLHGAWGAERAQLWVVDESADALGLVEELASERGVAEQVHVVQADPWTFVERVGCDHFQVVNAAGILDTVPFHLATRLVKEARRALAPGGVLVASQLARSIWSPVTRWLLRWPRTYRRAPVDLGHMLGTAGFNRPSYRIYREPLGICAIAVGYA